MKFSILLVLISVSLSSYAKQLKIMQYNAENFYDLTFDKGTEDYTYLPLEVKKTMPDQATYCNTLRTPFYIDQCLTLDWNKTIFDKKIASVARVINSFDSTGKGPDIIILQEIENIKVLDAIIKKGLKKPKYYKALIEGDDSRGIDVGVISKYPIISSVRHPLFLNGTKLNTRGITEVTIDVEGKKVIVFANHWPSQGAPTIQRLASAKLLSDKANGKEADLIIAAGDFNTIKKDIPYPFDLMPNFIDTEKEARKINPNIHRGTHYFNREWISLDKIFIHKNSKLKADYSTYEIMNRPFLIHIDSYTNEPAPFRFNAVTGEGYADHLPVGISVNY